MEFHVFLAADKGHESTESFMEVIYSTKKTSDSMLDFAGRALVSHDRKYCTE